MIISTLYRSVGKGVLRCLKVKLIPIIQESRSPRETRYDLAFMWLFASTPVAQSHRRKRRRTSPCGESATGLSREQWPVLHHHVNSGPGESSKMQQFHLYVQDKIWSQWLQWKKINIILKDGPAFKLMCHSRRPFSANVIIVWYKNFFHFS